MPLSIRPARPDDIGTVLALIRELADYEKLAHEVVATEADIAGALFCEHPKLFCDLAEWNGAVAGFAVWFVNFSTFAGKPGVYLEDLFVRPVFRRNGIGQALLGHLARTCVERDYARLQWSVLDWNAPSITFYKSLGAELMDGWTLCKVTGPALAQLAEKAP
ncbi:Putative acetyltransferase family protein; putative spermidine/spermine acetyltransferase [Bradyrhizobium sp. ORS 285]|uniref:GNAT family N-acetyltransferase n=1 Tax=Bradyrhizobium sp. ORS 285 TaxID=115808 RepID=UPI0002407F3A|nr:GNAT family N-acetyltransferase [Bradyrhizobium sp. ORS 285]CCD89691.1 putative acetyltransferase family protein; spermidine/spermine acetyltransferase [Bradyrhizobium sp. ORS 285]SMX56812.1 Putative acetyltransferase family protein; putative spermidine/spermine acetyltransferase [Bradyrhizobium sp. ORS 285]